jgi:hypothetical protein
VSLALVEVLFMDATLPNAPSQTSPAAPTMSLSARLFNIYATPGDVFESIKGVELCVWNWLVPVLLSCVVGIIYVFVAFAQPNVQQQIQELQEQQMQKLVDSGKLSAADMEVQRARMEGVGMTIARVAGAMGAAVMSFVTVFGLALVLKLLARFVLHHSVEYMKLVEITGLTGMVAVLGAVVQMLLVIIMGSIYVSVGPALFLGEFDIHNKAHLLLKSIDLMTFWYLAVLGVGLAKLAESTFWRATIPLFCGWALLRVGIVLVGWGAKGM